MAVALVQSKVAQSDTGALTATLDTGATAGNLLITTGSARWGASGPVGTFTVPSGYTLVFQVDPMEAHTVAVAFKVAAGGEATGAWTSTGTRSCSITSLYEFSGITDPVLDKQADDGSNATNVGSIATTTTGTLGASVGLAFLVGLNRQAVAANTLQNDASMTETFDNGILGGSVAYNECHAWQEFAATTAYNVTVSKSSGGDTRMGAGIVTFIADTGGGGTPIGQTAETDTPLAVSATKAKAVALVAETDTVLSVSAAKTKTLGLVASIDTPLPMTVTKSKAVGQVTEADSPLASTVAKLRTVGLVAESNNTQTLTSTKTRDVGLATETDTALGMSVEAPVLGQTAETDAALAVVVAKSKTVALVSSTEQPLSMTVLKTRTVGLAVETNLTFEVSTGGAPALELVTEADSPFAITAAKTKTVGFSTSTEQPLPLTVLKTITVGQVVESSLARPFVSAKLRTIGLATETDTAVGLGNIPVADDTVTAPTFRERSHADTYQEASHAGTFRERSHAPTYQPGANR